MRLSFFAFLLIIPLSEPVLHILIFFPAFPGTLYFLLQSLVFRIMLFQIGAYLFSYPYPQALLIPDDIWLCCHIGVSLLCSFPVPSTRLFHTSGRKLFTKPTEISWQILCNLSLFPQKNWYERLLVLSYQLSISYLTEYTFFSILCVSCTYLWQKSDYRHAIHSYAT